MWGLVRKDLTVNKKDYFLSALFYIIFGLVTVVPIKDIMERRYDGIDEAAGFIFEINLFLLMILIFIRLSEMSGIQIKSDEDARWNSFVLTTPVLFYGEVAAKYLANLCLTIVSAIYMFTCLKLSAYINGYGGRLIKTVIFVAAFFLMQSALELPLELRFGSKYGIYVKMFFIYIVAFAMTLYGLYGRLPDSFNIEGIIGFIDKYLFNVDYRKALPYIFSAIAFGIYFVSFAISCMILRHKEELNA